MRTIRFLAALLLLSFGIAPLAAEVASCSAYCDISESNCEYKDTGELDDVYVVNRFIRSVAAGNPAELAEIVSFPLQRDYPLPSIQTQQEFVQLYDEVIDEEFTRTIEESDQYDCGRPGWRPLSIVRSDANEPEQGGVPLVWFDDDGNVTRIWHETEVASQKRMALVEAERNQLHPSLHEYEYPVLEWETCTYRIRIDDLGNAFRYAAWRVDRFRNDNPDIVMTNGELVSEGTDEHRYFVFQNSEYKYLVYAGSPYYRDPAGFVQVFRTAAEPLLDETGDRRTTVEGWHARVQNVMRGLFQKEPILDEPVVNVEDRGTRSTYTRISSCGERES
jgi:hypothetical protein